LLENSHTTMTTNARRMAYSTPTIEKIAPEPGSDSELMSD
jgi:hypothetical protein